MKKEKSRHSPKSTNKSKLIEYKLMILISSNIGCRGMIRRSSRFQEDSLPPQPWRHKCPNSPPRSQNSSFSQSTIDDSPGKSYHFQASLSFNSSSIGPYFARHIARLQSLYLPKPRQKQPRKKPTYERFDEDLRLLQFCIWAVATGNALRTMYGDLDSAKRS